jgi:hypothetical protein
MLGLLLCRNQEDLDLFVQEVELMRKLRHRCVLAFLWGFCSFPGGSTPHRLTTHKSAESTRLPGAGGKASLMTDASHPFPRGAQHPGLLWCTRPLVARRGAPLLTAGTAPTNRSAAFQQHLNYRSST